MTYICISKFITSFSFKVTLIGGIDIRSTEIKLKLLKIVKKAYRLIKLSMWKNLEIHQKSEYQVDDLIYFV